MDRVCCVCCVPSPPPPVPVQEVFTCKFPPLWSTTPPNCPVFFRVFVGAAGGCAPVLFSLPPKWREERTAYDDQVARSFPSVVELTLQGEKRRVGFQWGVRREEVLCVQELVLLPGDQVVFMGQWMVPFGKTLPRLRHHLINPYSQAFSPPRGVVVSEMKGEVVWSPNTPVGKGEELLWRMEYLEGLSARETELDNEILLSVPFVDGGDGERDRQMCRQELVGNAAGYCRVQSTLLNLSDNFNADELWFTSLFMRGLYHAGVGEGEKRVMRCLEKVDMQVVKGLVRAITNHATSYEYRYDKLPMGRGEMLSVDMWQRRLQDGCGDCEDFGLLMLSLRNRFLEEEWKSSFLKGVQRILAGMDFMAVCVRAAAPKLDPGAGACVAEVSGESILAAPKTMEEARRIQKYMGSFHVACFFMGKDYSPVAGLEVDEKEKWRRRGGLRDELRGCLFTAEGTFSYDEQTLENEVTQKELKEWVRGVEMLQGRKAEVLHFPTGASKKGFAELGSIYGPVIEYLLPFEVQHPDTEEWSNLMLTKTGLEGREVAGVVPVAGLKDGTHFALSPILPMDRELNNIQSRLLPPTPLLTTFPRPMSVGGPRPKGILARVREGEGAPEGYKLFMHPCVKAPPAVPLSLLTPPGPR